MRQQRHPQQPMESQLQAMKKRRTAVTALPMQVRPLRRSARGTVNRFPFKR
jgi:hypothetical protein